MSKIRCLIISCLRQVDDDGVGRLPEEQAARYLGPGAQGQHLLRPARSQGAPASVTQSAVPAAAVPERRRRGASRC